MSSSPSIRGRMVLALAGVSVLTLLVVGAVFYVFLGSYVLDQQRDRMVEQAVEVAEQVEGLNALLPAGIEGSAGRVVVRRSLAAKIRTLPSGTGIVVFVGPKVIAHVGVLPERTVSPDRLQRLRSQAEELGASEPSSAVVETELGEDDQKVAAIVAVAPMELSDGTSGLVVVTLPRADAFAYRSGVLRTLLISGAVAVGIAILVGIVLGSWMTRPLRRLSAAAHGMALGSYEEAVTGSYPGEMQEVADSLETMRQEVQRSEDSLRGFVSSAAHELRTPLTSIQGFSQALLDGTASTEEERSRSAAAIHKESTRLRRLVDSLLTLSRYDSHEFRPSYARVHIEDLVQEEVQRLVEAGVVEEGHISVRREGLAEAVTDGDMLRQVIANLLHNAVRHGQGSPVEVSVEVGEESLTLEVANGGEPLSTEERTRIFSRFYRGRTAHQSEGFGLGLALVWEICGLMGGRIELLDGGPLTRFRVTLPSGGQMMGKGENRG